MRPIGSVVVAVVHANLATYFLKSQRELVDGSSRRANSVEDFQ